MRQQDHKDVFAVDGRLLAASQCLGPFGAVGALAVPDHAQLGLTDRSWPSRSVARHDLASSAVTDPSTGDAPSQPLKRATPKTSTYLNLVRLCHCV